MQRTIEVLNIYIYIFDLGLSQPVFLTEWISNVTSLRVRVSGGGEDVANNLWFTYSGSKREHMKKKVFIVLLTLSLIAEDWGDKQTEADSWHF